MATKPAPVSDDELLRLIQDEMTGGCCFENDDRISARGDDKDATGLGEREAALEYFNGRMRDLPAEEGRSRAVSHDVADTVEAMLPGLMRVFAGTDRVVEYAPAREGDEAGAEQASAYVNWVWANEVNGYLVLYTAILDALKVRNGVIKAYWDDTPEFEAEDLTGLDEMQLALLFGDPDLGIPGDPEIELVGSRLAPQYVPDPATGQMVEAPLWDVRVRRVVQNGRLKVENTPPERFGVSKGAKSLDTALCVWETFVLTRSDLLKRGFDPAVVADLPAYGGRIEDDVLNRDDDTGRGAVRAGANAEVEITEAYVFADRDGDGIAESRKVVLAGAEGQRTLLSDEPWTTDRPYVALPCMPVEHRWMARSVADLVMPAQRIKTALTRQFMDAIYLQNNPAEEVLDSAIIDYDEVRDRSFGRQVRVKAQGAIRPLTTPFMGGVALQGLQLMDATIKRRTGVDQATASLDATALEPQTATAEQLEHDASYAKVELIARHMAELGLKPLFGKILRLIVRNQDRPRTIRLRDGWKSYDPRAWNAAMDASVNVGLGTGSRERDLKMLAGIAARQEQVVQQLGVDNPVVRPSMLLSTYRKIVEAAGLKDPESYFAPVSDDEFLAWQAQRAQTPNPAAEAQAQRLELDRQKAAADAQLKREAQQADAVLDQQALEAKLAAQAQELEQRYALKIEEMRQAFELRERELMLEAQLKGTALAYDVRGGASTNVPRPQ